MKLQAHRCNSRTAGIISFVLDSLEANTWITHLEHPRLIEGFLVNGTDGDGNKYKFQMLISVMQSTALRGTLILDGIQLGNNANLSSSTLYSTGWGLVNLSNIDPIISHLNGSSPLPDRPRCCGLYGC